MHSHDIARRANPIEVDVYKEVSSSKKSFKISVLLATSVLQIDLSIKNHPPGLMCSKHLWSCHRKKIGRNFLQMDRWWLQSRHTNDSSEKLSYKWLY